MRMTRALAVGLLMVTVFIAGCPVLRGGRAGGRGSAAGTGSVSGQCRGDFGTTHAAAKIEAFLGAAAEFGDTAVEIENELRAACQRMGRALGMAESELVGAGSEGMSRMCAAVNDRFRAEMQAIRAASSVQVNIETRPPHCEVSMDAYASCAAECEAQVDPGSIQLECEGGELRGRCTASCTGSCAVEVSGQCGGTCEGFCDGQCTQTAADGSCAGRCEGSCRGQCVAQASGSCTGECRGGCSVEFQEPYCTGEVRPASVSARCRASCNARLEAHARCEPGEARMSVSGGVDPSMQPRVAAVQAAVREGLGAILTLRTRLERLSSAGREIARLAPELPNAAATVGIGAVACATSAAGAIADSMSRVSVSLEVSVSVSASASVSSR